MAKFEIVVRSFGPDGSPVKTETFSCDGYLLAAGEGTNINLSNTLAPSSVLFFLELLREKYVSRQIRANMMAADQAQMASGIAVAQSLPKLSLPRNES